MDYSLPVRTAMPDAGDNDSMKANILDLVTLLATPANLHSSTILARRGADGQPAHHQSAHIADLAR